jgi:hypothetical protein
VFSQARLKEDQLLQVGQNLARGALAGLDAAVQVALEVHGGVLAGEVDLPVLAAFDAAELCLLADLPVRIGALCEGVVGSEVDRCPAVPVRRDARQHRFDLGQELLGPLRRRARAEACPDVSASG